jgi:hypothetical protein
MCAECELMWTMTYVVKLVVLACSVADHDEIKNFLVLFVVKGTNYKILYSMRISYDDSASSANG